MYYPVSPGNNVYENPQAKIDYSNINEGYIIVETGLDKADNRSWKIEEKKGDEKVIFDVFDRQEVIPLIFGDGEYMFRIMKQTVANPTLYSPAMFVALEHRARENNIRLRYPNQRVNYTEKSAAVLKAAEICRQNRTEAERMIKIYDFIYSEFTYDTNFANVVKPGYLPNCDRTLLRKSGICCDIAELFAVMCRSQGMLCKYVTGYVKVPDRNEPLYHAYNRVWVGNEMLLPCGVHIKARNWEIVDPTFGMSGGGQPLVAKWIDTDSNYSDKHSY